MPKPGALDAADGATPPDVLAAKVRAWLEQQGYPFELQVGLAARNAGWFVRHEQSYTDPATGKARPIDLVAEAVTISPQADWLSVALAIECKRTSEGQPWVLIRSETAISSAVTTSPGVTLSTLLRHTDAAAARLACPRLLGEHQPTAHIVVRASMHAKHLDGDELVARSAFLSAATAATALAAHHEQSLARGPVASGWLTCYVPAVVISGRLCEAVSRADGTLDVQEVEEGLWLAPPASPGMPSMVVAVVTVAAWRRVASQLLGEAHELARLASPVYSAARHEISFAGKRARAKLPPSVSYPFSG